MDGIPMVPPDAFQVIVIAHEQRAESGDYPKPKDFVETIRNSFVRLETNEIVRELSLVDDQGTGAAVRKFYVSGIDLTKPLPPPPRELEKALHSLVVLLVTAHMVNDKDVMEALDRLAEAVLKSKKRHGLLVLGWSESLLGSFREKAQELGLKSLGIPQGISVEKLGEYAVRPAYAAILALSRAHRLLFRGSNDEPGMRLQEPKARFFISHAKLDGLPLAHSLTHILERLAWLDYFYDARDIQSGDDFREILEYGVLDSMLLVLRTDIYDLRFWCRQEVMWAEERDRPVLLVDARTELLSRPTTLGFTGIPGVRIPDGNLVRVLIEALREWVRIGILTRRFEHIPACAAFACTELLSRTPGLTALSAAIDRLKKRNPLPQSSTPSSSAAHPAGNGQEVEASDSHDRTARVCIVHAEPSLDETYSRAAGDLLRSSFPHGVVLSFRKYCSQIP